MKYSAEPLYSVAWVAPSKNLDYPEYAITVEWKWPEGDWTRFRIVRSIRSPAVRVEEGETMIETTLAEWDDYERKEDTNELVPRWTDPQPPDGEWIYYTAFFLGPNRIWSYGGSTLEIGPGDYDWTIKLPQLLPGGSISTDVGVTSQPDQDSDLVQFLQIPGGYLDRMVSMAEAVQYFWDPKRVPPQLVPAMFASLGYQSESYEQTLGLGRLREVAAALLADDPGSVRFARRFAEAVMGTNVFANISNNLMVSVADSSFEVDDLTETQWAPQTNLELRSYLSWPLPVPTVAPGLILGKFLRFTGADTIRCGASDPPTYGIPVNSWKYARAGCYAFETGTSISISLDLYDFDSNLVRTLVLMEPQALTSVWDRYSTPYEQPVLLSPDFAPATAKTTAGDWSPQSGGDYADPQVIPTVDTDGLIFAANEAPTTDGLYAGWLLTGTGVTGLTVGITYDITVTVDATSGSAPWRVTADGEASGWNAPIGVPQTMTFEWTATVANPALTFEVQKPDSADWTDVGTHLLRTLTVTDSQSDVAYGIPVVTADGPCSVDLIVIDDAEGPAIQTPEQRILV